MVQVTLRSAVTLVDIVTLSGYDGPDIQVPGLNIDCGAGCTDFMFFTSLSSRYQIRDNALKLATATSFQTVLFYHV
jgi:hypothetical protein